MVKMKFFSSLLLLLFVCFGLNAQVSSLATIDSSFIKIGQQTQIRVVVDAPKDMNISFPNLQQGDSLTSGVELLQVSKTDTSLFGEKYRYKKDYLVTAFDSGVYHIPPFVMKVNGNVVSQTRELTLEVLNIDREIVDGQFEDIKGLMGIGFDYMIILWILLAILLIIGIVFGIIYWMKNRKVEVVEVKEPERVLKPHEVALLELDRIKEAKIWNQSQYKQYYTELTDTLREYLSRRFAIPAWEMTSSEILDALQYKEEARQVCDKLKQIFSISDMVKFAKMNPDDEICNLSLVNGYFVVNQTIEREPVVLDADPKDETPKAENPQSEGSTAEQPQPEERKDADSSESRWAPKQDRYAPPSTFYSTSDDSGKN
ncbi:MAG: BatD family protein [Paludibacteraceae bacterium]|nr:BatD family protein [Paludibacteraceae bacterium]